MNLLKNKKMKEQHFYKIYSCIRSCNTLEEFTSCNNMIKTFRKMFKDSQLEKELNTYLYEKYHTK